MCTEINLEVDWDGEVRVSNPLRPARAQELARHLSTFDTLLTLNINGEPRSDDVHVACSAPGSPRSP